ncbi:hypothetical protein QJS66_23050 [Kocuria rhizophila]|nr:hypothetical protein QJS66_23050 [Kocuria rhizophila]
MDLDPAPRPQATTADLVGDGAGAGIWRDPLQRNLHSSTSWRGWMSAQRWQRTHLDEQDQLRKLRPRSRSSRPSGTRAGPHERRRGRPGSSTRTATTVVSRRVTAPARAWPPSSRSRCASPRGAVFRGSRPRYYDAARRIRASGPGATASRATVEHRLAPVSLTVGGGREVAAHRANGAGKSTRLSSPSGRLGAPRAAPWYRAPGSARGLLGRRIRVPRGPRPHRGQGLPGPRGRGTRGGGAAGHVRAARGAGREPAVGELSVGQRRRLALAALLAAAPARAAAGRTDLPDVSRAGPRSSRWPCPSTRDRRRRLPRPPWLRRANGRHLRLEAPAV